MKLKAPTLVCILGNALFSLFILGKIFKVEREILSNFLVFILISIPSEIFPKIKRSLRAFRVFNGDIKKKHIVEYCFYSNSPWSCMKISYNHFNQIYLLAWLSTNYSQLAFWNITFNWPTMTGFSHQFRISCTSNWSPVRN